MMAKERWLLFLLIVGFGTLLLEVRYLHREVVEEHWQGWIPSAVAGLSALACLAALVTPSARKFAMAVFALGVVAGLVGEYYHTGYRPEVFRQLAALEEITVEEH